MTQTSHLFKISQKGSLQAPKPIRQKIHEIDKQYIDANLDILLGVKPVGCMLTDIDIRVDTVALTPNETPVFIYYDTGVDDIIQQSIYEIDTLDTYKSQLRKALKTADAAPLDRIRWSDARAVCIGTEFTPQQRHMLSLFDKPVSLYMYNLLESNYMTFQQVETKRPDPINPPDKPLKRRRGKAGTGRDVFKESIARMDTKHRNLYDSITGGLAALSSDVEIQIMKRHAKIQRRNHLIQMYPNSQDGLFKLHVTVDTTDVTFDTYTIRDISETSYLGNVELVIRSIADYNRVLPIIKTALGLPPHTK